MREFGIAVVIALVIGVVGYAIVGLSDDDNGEALATRPAPTAPTDTSSDDSASDDATDDSATDDSATDDSATDDSATDDSATDDSATDDSATDDDAGEVSADLGESIAQATGCLACHTTDGSVTVGPSWGGLFGSTEEIDGGEEVVVDRAYLRESITNPGARIVAGFGNLMPGNYGDTLSDAEIDSIVEYIVTLQ